MQHRQHIMLYYFKKGKNACEMQRKICVVYGEGAVTEGTCQKWFVKFQTGDFLLDEAPQLGRPGEVDSDHIETLTENNQRSTTRERADILRISRSVKLLVKMKNVCFQRSPGVGHGRAGEAGTRVLEGRSHDLQAEQERSQTAQCREARWAGGSGKNSVPHVWCRRESGAIDSHAEVPAVCVGDPWTPGSESGQLRAGGRELGTKSGNGTHRPVSGGAAGEGE